VADVLEKNYNAACSLMSDNNQKVNSSMCPKASATLDVLRQAWMKNVVTLPPKVTVSGASVKGTSATVPDTGVRVDGHTLRELELIGASGNTSTFTMSLSLQQLSTGWYVNNVNTGF